jgi:hypothetical protein
LAGRVGGDTAQVHAAAPVFNEEQDVQPFQEDRIDVEQGSIPAFFRICQTVEGASL